MIQRIQNVFLALAAIIIVLMFFFSIADFYDDLAGNYRLLLTGLKCMDPDPKIKTSVLMTLPMVLLAALSVILSLVTIIYYKTRTMQLRLIAINILITIVLIIVIFLFCINSVQKLTGISPAYQFGAFCPLICLVFLIVANRFIRRDENLVKSAERLR